MAVWVRQRKVVKEVAGEPYYLYLLYHALPLVLCSFYIWATTRVAPTRVCAKAHSFPGKVGLRGALNFLRY